jgi:signal transduction histidine kinase
MGAISFGELLLPALQPQIRSPGEVSAYVVEAPSDVLLSIGESAPTNLADHGGVQAVLRGERGSSFLPMADGEHVVAFAPIPSAGWGLVVEEPWETVTSSVLDLSLLAPFSLVPILLLTILGLWFGARRVIEPLRRLEEASMELPAGSTEAIERPVGGIAEIEQLRTSLLRMSQRVAEAQSALRAYIGVITNAQEEERRRIARELHDESIQHWIALDQRLQMAVKRLRDQAHPEAETLSELHREAQGGIKELRRLSRGLRPIYLEDLGLVPAIEMLARDAEDALGLPIRIQVQGKSTRLTAESELAVYRLVQESLSNAGRHAEASSAEIRLVFGERLLEVGVADDGKGFSPPDRFESLAATGHYGLLGMKERADSIEGILEIDSFPGKGTRIRLSVPTSRKAKSDA